MSEENQHDKIIEALRDPKTTIEVAKELGIGSCTTLQKLRKLYSAGMIRRVLDGDIQKWVLDDSLHERSPFKRACCATLMGCMTSSPQTTKELSDKTGWSKDTVSNYLKDLERKGLVVRQYFHKSGQPRYGWYIPAEQVATQDVAVCQ